MTVTIQTVSASFLFEIRLGDCHGHGVIRTRCLCDQDRILLGEEPGAQLPAFQFEARLVLTFRQR